MHFIHSIIHFHELIDSCVQQIFFLVSPEPYMLTLEGLAKGHITQGNRGKIWVL